MQQIPDLIGTAEASRILNVNVSTITRWAADGVLPVIVKRPSKNGAMLFDRKDVNQLAAERSAA